MGIDFAIFLFSSFGFSNCGLPKAFEADLKKKIYLVKVLTKASRLPKTFVSFCGNWIDFQGRLFFFLFF